VVLALRDSSFSSRSAETTTELPPRAVTDLDIRNSAGGSVDRFRWLRARGRRNLHWVSADSAGGRPGAASLIEGKMKDIMPFLDRLSHGDNIPPQVAQTREKWRKKWSNNPWAHGKGQGS